MTEAIVTIENLPREVQDYIKQFLTGIEIIKCLACNLFPFEESDIKTLSFKGVCFDKELRDSLFWTMQNKSHMLDYVQELDFTGCICLPKGNLLNFLDTCKNSVAWKLAQTSVDFIALNEHLHRTKKKLKVCETSFIQDKVQMVPLKCRFASETMLAYADTLQPILASLLFTPAWGPTHIHCIQHDEYVSRADLSHCFVNSYEITISCSMNFKASLYYRLLFGLNSPFATQSVPLDVILPHLAVFDEEQMRVDFKNTNGALFIPSDLRGDFSTLPQEIIAKTMQVPYLTELNFASIRCQAFPAKIFDSMSRLSVNLRALAISSCFLTLHGVDNDDDDEALLWVSSGEKLRILEIRSGCRNCQRRSALIGESILGRRFPSLRQLVVEGVASQTNLNFFQALSHLRNVTLNELGFARSVLCTYPKYLSGPLASCSRSLVALRLHHSRLDLGCSEIWKAFSSLPLLRHLSLTSKRACNITESLLSEFFLERRCLETFFLSCVKFSSETVSSLQGVCDAHNDRIAKFYLVANYMMDEDNRARSELLRSMRYPILPVVLDFLLTPDYVASSRPPWADQLGILKL